MVLIPISSNMAEAFLKGPEAFESAYRCNPGPVEKQLGPIIESTLALYAQKKMAYPWLGYLATGEDGNQIVGTCGFKGPPSGDQTVEIAYHTFPAYEGKGYARLMVENLVDIAATSCEVNKIIAHTLPEKNDSVRVLEKNKFRCEGETMHPEDGKVWEWVHEVQ